MQTFLNVYESWWTNEGQSRLSKKRIQTRVIQMVYDLRFVHMLLERKDNTTVNPMTFLFLFFNENSILEYQRYERTIFQIN